MAKPTIRKIFSKLDFSSKITAMTGSPVPTTDPRTASLWYDMKNFTGFGVSVQVDSAIAIDSIEFQASKSSDGSTPISVKSVDLTDITTTAIGDYINTELHESDVIQAVTAQELGGVSGLSEYRYISAVITSASGNVNVAYIGQLAHQANADLLSVNKLT